LFQLKTLSGDLSKIIFFILLLSALLGVFIFHRDVVVDEGNYLYAGRLVAAGRISDMVYYSIQGPVFTLSQGIFHLLFGPDFLVRRIIMTAFGIGGLIFAGFISKKIGGIRSLSIYFMILITSVYVLAHYNVIVTYSLAAFFLYLALFIAISYNNKIILPYLIILIAASIRLSILSVVPVFIVYLTIRSQNKKKIFVTLAAVTILFFSTVFGLFIIKSPAVLFYNLIGRASTAISMVQRFSMMGEILRLNFKDYGFILFIFILSFTYICLKKDKYRKELVFLFFTFIVLFIAHLFPLAAGGSYYNSLNLPLTFVIIACALDKIIKYSKIGVLFVIFILIANFTEQSLLVRKHRIFQKENPIKKINYVSKYIKETAGAGKIILTFNTLLASQSGKYIPLNFALGCFSYEPSWPSEKCEKYKTVNSEIFLDYVSDKEIGLIALGDFDLHQFGPSKKNILKKIEKEGFVFVKKFENFGQWHDNFYIFTRK